MFRVSLWVLYMYICLSLWCVLFVSVRVVGFVVVLVCCLLCCIACLWLLLWCVIGVLFVGFDSCCC